MNGIGLDCGNATLKLVLLSPEKVPLGKNGFPLWSGGSERPPSAGGAFSRGPGGLRLPGGHHRKRGRPAERGVRCPGRAGGDPSHPPRVRLLAPEARSAIEIGSQSARFLTGLDQNTPPRFAVNEHCAGGTGSFFEDQMSRLGLKLEDYSRLVGQARSIPSSPAAARSSPKRTSSTGSRRGCPHRTSSWAFATPWCATTRR